jgi:hypothetical protein
MQHITSASMNAAFEPLAGSAPEKVGVVASQVKGNHEHD